MEKDYLLSPIDTFCNLSGEANNDFGLRNVIYYSFFEAELCASISRIKVELSHKEIIFIPYIYNSYLIRLSS